MEATKVILESINTPLNRVIIASLRKLDKKGETKWVGNTTFTNIQHCLTSINLEVLKNSGWYTPKAIRINGLTGIYMVNEDGSLCYEFRIIKEDDKKYRIETMTMAAYNEFEQLYCQFLHQ